MIDHILRVARREYSAYVRTRAFIISAIALPVSLLLAIGLPLLLESVEKPPRSFTIVDDTGRYGTQLLDRLINSYGDTEGILSFEMRDYIHLTAARFHIPEEVAARQRELEMMVQNGELFAFLLIRPGETARECTVDYFTIDPASDGLPRALRRTLNDVIIREQLLPLVGDEELLLSTLRGVDLRTHAVTEEGGELATAAHVARSYAPMGFTYLLWIAVLSMSSHLMTSTLEEKASRIIEVLLSSVSPFEFMMGKLVGLAGAGLTMIGIWIVTGSIGLSAIPNQTVMQVAAGIASAFSLLTIIWFCVFFLLGFLFFSAIFVGLGSVCNTLREAQSLIQPIMFVLIVPLLLMVYVTKNPDHIVAVIASFFPPFTPFVIMNRIPATPPAPLWQVVLAALLLLIATWMTVRAAAKVFRIGVLMYGKPPTLPEILRWARQPS
jgi:ABC-2 type transport system permease protein